MKTEKDDRKVEKSYLIENWLTLNKTPFSPVENRDAA